MAESSNIPLDTRSLGMDYSRMAPRRAFALIEVIIVLIVLSVLASIALGTVHNAKAKAYVAVMQSEDDDFSQLVAQLRSDLNRYNKRESDRQPAATTKAATTASSA